MADEQQQELEGIRANTELACWLVEFKPTFFDPTTFARLDDKTVVTWSRLVINSAAHGSRVRKFHVLSGSFIVPDSILDEDDHKAIGTLKSYGMLAASRRTFKGTREKVEVKATNNAATKAEVGLKEFDAFWKLYPARSGSKPFATQTKRWFLQNITTKQLYEDLLKAVENYAKSGRVLSGYVRDCPNWVANDHWKSWINETLDTPMGYESQRPYQGKVVV